MVKLRIRITVFVLSMLFIVISLPITATSGSYRKIEYSQDTVENDIGSCIDQNAVNKELDEKVGQGIIEIESLREETAKHFQLEDGNYQAIAYCMAVHRKDAEGKWQDIDNRLYPDSKNPGMFSTGDGMFSFSASSSADTLFTVSNGAFSVSFGLLFNNRAPSTAVIENHPDRHDIANNCEGEEKLAALISIDNTTRVTYDNVCDGMDLEYVISGNDVKENIILTNPIKIGSLDFKMDLSGLAPELTENGSIKLIDKNNETVYCITTPFMYDASGEECNNIYYVIERSGECYSLQLVVDDDWINDSDRLFPVIIDPSVMVCPQIIGDTYVSSSSPSSNYGSSAYVRIRSNTIAYLKASMPTLPIYAKISSASLTTKCYSEGSSGSIEINAYRCKRSWDESSLTWNTVSSWSNNGLATARCSHATANVISSTDPASAVTLVFSVTSLIKGWYAGNSNLGLGLKYNSGAVSAVRIHSRESSTNYRPYFTIVYTVISNPVIKNGTYFFENKKTGKYMDIQDYEEGISEGSYTHQWKFLGLSNQKWIVKYTHDSNYYTIKSMKASSYYLRVKDDSPEANIRVMLSKGTDSNGTRTLANSMIWGFSTTSSGAYKISAKVGEPYDRVLAVGSYVLNINGIDIEQRNYSNNTDYIDEWMPYKTDGQTDMFLAITESDGRDRVSGFDPIFGYIYNYGRNDFNFRYTNSLSVSNCLSQMEDATIYICVQRARKL
ncbi:MAG: RICIN domain-containing protein [Clostridia bacterium]|nr:RICIN domain-containing protein [Clostridia bacterium]